ncbi:unnamed protein product [Gongylonema pulchrum]|uniref:MBD domain-containing protein n=1 Tax=Gongylonema pulchrum TaxID=637853 RepID=A0A183E931_9BILA|nr:unnamed protein product [Gongylonema pulchrum]
MQTYGSKGTILAPLLPLEWRELVSTGISGRRKKAKQQKNEQQLDPVRRFMLKVIGRSTVSLDHETVDIDDDDDITEDVRLAESALATVGGNASVLDSPSTVNDNEHNDSVDSKP